jgi:hypothetical protein
VCGWVSATAQNERTGNGQVLFELFELAEVGVAGGGGGEWMFIAERVEAGGR